MNIVLERTYTCDAGTNNKCNFQISVYPYIILGRNSGMDAVNSPPANHWHALPWDFCRGKPITSCSAGQRKYHNILLLHG